MKYKAEACALYLTRQIPYISVRKVIYWKQCVFFGCGQDMAVVNVTFLKEEVL